MSRACSSVDALVLRAARGTARRTARAGRWSVGSVSVAADRSTPSSAARARTWASSPRMVRSATPRRSSRSAACRIRSSSPSGSTMRLRSARARSISWCSNISGVVTVGIGTASRSSRSAVDVLSISRRAVSILRCESASPGRGSPRPRSPSRTGPGRWRSIGSRRPSPVTRRRDRGCSESPPLRTIADNDGNPSAAWALTTASTTSDRSPGVMTATPSVSRSRTWSAGHPGHQHAASPRGSAVTRRR